MKLFKPELSDGKMMNILVRDETPASAIIKCQRWLNTRLNDNERYYFTGTDKPFVSDALEVVPEDLDIIVV